MFLEGHQKEILTVDWSPTGYAPVCVAIHNSPLLIVTLEKLHALVGFEPASPVLMGSLRYFAIA